MNNEKLNTILCSAHAISLVSLVLEVSQVMADTFLWTYLDIFIHELIFAFVKLNAILAMARGSSMCRSWYRHLFLTFAQRCVGKGQRDMLGYALPSRLLRLREYIIEWRHLVFEQMNVEYFESGLRSIPRFKKFRKKSIAPMQGVL